MHTRVSPRLCSTSWTGLRTISQAISNLVTLMRHSLQCARSNNTVYCCGTVYIGTVLYTDCCCGVSNKLTEIVAQSNSSVVLCTMLCCAVQCTAVLCFNVHSSVCSKKHFTALSYTAASGFDSLFSNNHQRGFFCLDQFARRCNWRNPLQNHRKIRLFLN